MEFEYKNKEVVFKKELNELDNLALEFSGILNSLKIENVYVSGYVSILFGRSRSSEDIDLIIEEIDYPLFTKLWDSLSNDFECLNSSNKKEAYDLYLNSSHSLRFAKKGKFEPNMEVKFPKTSLDKLALKEKIKVTLNNKILYISPIEQQISFKFYLGSEKDIEDAKHLFNIFKDKLDMDLLNEFNRKLKVVEIFDKYIKKIR